MIETVLLFLHRILQHPAVLSLIVLLALFFFRRKLLRRKERNGIYALSRETRQLAAVFSSFEKSLAKKSRRKRPPDRTLQEFYADASPEIRSLVSEYEEMRYREQVPEKEHIRSFERQCRGVLKQMGKK